MTRTVEEPALREVLEEGLSNWLGRPIRIVDLAARPLDTRSTYPIEHLQVALDSGEQLPVIFKQLRPEPGRDGCGREVLIYRRLLAGRRFGAPALYASAHDERRGRYWLFLEDVGSVTLRKYPWEAWCVAVRWLAEMHGTYLGRQDELRALGCLGEQDAEAYLAGWQAARHNLELAGVEAALPRFDLLTQQVPALAEYLARQPRTLVHGDVFTENIMVQPGPRVRPVDWESASLGLAALDLARLLEGWEDKPALLDCYFGEFTRHVAVPLDRDAFRVSFRLCDVLLVLLDLAWSVESCASPGFVDQRLDELEALWHQLDREGPHV